MLELVIPDHRTPDSSHLVDLNMLVLADGRERTEDEFRALLSATAWRVERIMQQAANDVGRAWAALSQGFQSLSKALQQGNPLPPLAPVLSGNKAGWQFLLDECTGWQRVGLFPVVLLQPTTCIAA